MQSADGRLLETIPYRIGFRRFEIKDRVMLLNGERLIINGVNRHEWNARRGRAVTRENMEEDIDIFTRNNINAVRTCHYPDQSLWYQLCDENGICMMDEGKSGESRFVGEACGRRPGRKRAGQSSRLGGLCGRPRSIDGRAG